MTDLERNYTGKSSPNGVRFAYKKKIFASSKTDDGIEFNFKKSFWYKIALIAILCSCAVVCYLVHSYIVGSVLCSLVLLIALAAMNRSNKKWHSAEHQVLAAFRKWERLPTIEECAEASPISKWCGSASTLSLVIILVSWGAFMDFIAAKNWIVCLCAVATAILGWISHKRNTLIFIQKLALAKPDKYQLQIAHKTFSELLDLIEKEKSMQANYMDSI